MGSGSWTWHWRPDLPVRERERQNTPLYLYAVFTMRASIVLDDGLVQQAMELTGARTKREVVHIALSSLVERRMRKNLLDLAGEIDFKPGFDHKELRELRDEYRHDHR